MEVFVPQTVSLWRDVERIVSDALRDASPDAAVRRAIDELPYPEGKLVLVAIGKAAWQMAASALDALGDRVDDGIVITKRGCAEGPLGKLTIREAGHPVPDQASYDATEEAIRLVEPLGEKDVVLFLVSGGGSALFEKPTIPPEEIAALTERLLACGASIVEINALRKRLSAVKGGRFAEICAPARVFSILLSDIVGDPLDMIASGPAYPDASTCEQAARIVEKYRLDLSERARKQLAIETPKKLDNVETRATGSVKYLCQSAASSCEKLGYFPILLTDRLSCEAREAGSFLASIVRTSAETPRSLAFIVGGEPVVHLTGKGLGGRAQELVLSAAREIAGLENVALFSFGSDGTDGPTDAAGAVCDGESAEKLEKLGFDIFETLRDNDSHRALKAIEALIKTGPTGTNVNDLTCALIKR